MNKFPSKETVIRLREQYPHGCRVELVQMDDPYSKLKPGDLGTVDFVDDTGTIFCIWDGGSTLGVVFGEDVVKKVSVKIDATPMDERIKEQILCIRADGSEVDTNE